MTCTHRDHSPRFNVTLATGERFEGVGVQGCGGLVSSERVLHAAVQRAEEGRPLPVYEPLPGYVSLHLGITRDGPTEVRAVPAKGATFRLACCQIPHAGASQ